MSNLFDISGKVVLITGSTRGIGLTLATGLGLAGAKIILNGRNEAKLRDVLEPLRSKGIEAYGYAFDVCNEAAVTESVAIAERVVGSIDALINNAGLQIRGPLEQFEEKDWKRIIDVNLTGAFIASKAVAKGMIDRRKGKIINICSVQSELARPSISPYTASKGGLKMLTKGMATEWGKYNIQVNGIAPGYFRTEMTHALYEDPKFNEWLCSRVPANRWGEPEELVGAAIFLASSASDYVNGHILYVDGGMTACV